MDKFDKKVRQFLVEEGYLFPETDAEVERSLAELETLKIKVPTHLDKLIMDAIKGSDKTTSEQ